MYCDRSRVIEKTVKSQTAKCCWSNNRKILIYSVNILGHLVILGLQSICLNVADKVSHPRRLDSTMELITFFVLWLQHGCHDLLYMRIINKFDYWLATNLLRHTGRCCSPTLGQTHISRIRFQNKVSKKVTIYMWVKKYWWLSYSNWPNRGCNLSEVAQLSHGYTKHIKQVNY